MYSPNLGRWVQVDPIEYEAGDPNLYRFVGNNPVNRLDPTGLDPELTSTVAYQQPAKDGDAAWGSFVVGINWKVKGPPKECKGFILQHITVKTDLQNAKPGSTVVPVFGGKKQNGTDTFYNFDINGADYWEAWGVDSATGEAIQKASGTLTVVRNQSIFPGLNNLKGIPVANDVFAFARPSEFQKNATTGTITHSGEAFFTPEIFKKNEIEALGLNFKSQTDAGATLFSVNSVDLSDSSKSKLAAFQKKTGNVVKHTVTSKRGPTGATTVTVGE